LTGGYRGLLAVFSMCIAAIVDCCPRHVLKSLLAPQSRSFLGHELMARGLGGRLALVMSPRLVKEVIQVAHKNVGSVASLGALVGGEVHR
jgi:hypothetical protein